MAFAKQNPKIPEGINTSADNPLKEFFILLFGVFIILGSTMALLLVFAHSLGSYIPFRYEQKLMSNYGQWTRSEPGHSAALQDAETAIQELGQNLARQSGLAAGISTQFYLLDQADAANAFATLGGQIFVTTGLLREVSSENALAMVLAHEIAHIKYRHPAQSLSGGLLVQLFLSIVAGGQDATALKSTAQQTGVLTMLGFSRKMEDTADKAAMNTLENYYGHLAGTEEFFAKILGQHQQARWQALFTSHPDLRQRIEYIQTRAQILTQVTGAQPNTKALDPRLEKIQNILANSGYQGRDPSERQDIN
ncbi:MAG: putative Zn-dependent protease [Zhongshania sp.]